MYEKFKLITLIFATKNGSKIVNERYFQITH